MSAPDRQFNLIRKALLEFEDYLDRDTDHTKKYYTDAEYAARIYRQAHHIGDTLLLDERNQKLLAPTAKPPPNESGTDQ
jgi:hypothetical protein